MKSTLTPVLIIFVSAIATRAQRTKCGPGRFECGDGDCIPSGSLCDGRVDCKDQSDETESECNKPELLCPAYAFRCAYGACVDGDAPCNGKKDCADNSDETLPRCDPAGSSNVPISRGDCSANEFKCNNGQCIPRSALCDGRTDCSDKSDETAEKCSERTCIEFLFRCNYGACVDGDAKCNGINDCADGSDEDPSLCRVPTSVNVPPIRPPIIPQGPPVVTNGPAQFCIAPPQPPNGHWRLHESLCTGGRQSCDLNPGARLDPGTYIVYTCNQGYKLAGFARVYCDAQGMLHNIPVCIEIHCPPLNSASTQATNCLRNNNHVSCDSSVLPGTTAELSCRASYQEDRTILSRRRRVECNERGLWEPEPIRCVPECGVIYPNTVPYIVNGEPANITDFPWHATLYRENYPGGPKEFICGATIVKNNILLTAAHCIFNEKTKRIHDPARFHIVTGNIYRDYDSPGHDERIVRKAAVKNLYLQCNYFGYDGNYAADIAVIEIAVPFNYTTRLLPACLDTNVFGDTAVLEPGKTGNVAGFGRTAFGENSYLLMTLKVPYVPQGQCKSSNALYDSERLFTQDKFCAGYTNGSAVCDGDSGGGLVFQTAGLWYLRGIVSTGVGVNQDGGAITCKSDTYSLYTRISNHIQWVQDVMYNLDMHQFYSC